MADKVDVLADLKQARAALSQNATYPADVALARNAIDRSFVVIAELIAAVQDERILRDLGADVDSKTLASAMRRTSAALRNCRAASLAGAAQ